MKQKGIRILSITGGKGGVGKSHVSANLGVSLAKLGLKTMLFDADLGLANLDILFGLRVKKNLSHVLAKECTLRDIIVEGPSGLKIIPAASGIRSMLSLSESECAGIIYAFSELEQELDIFLIDTAAGLSNSVLHFNRAAQKVIVIVCDEPTSITDAYALIKILNQNHQINRFKILTNMVSTSQQGEAVFQNLASVSDKFLDVHLEYMGMIPYDEQMKSASKNQKVITELYPNCPASKAFRALSKKILDWPQSPEPSGHLEFFLERVLQGS